ncbi:Lysosome membrane protein 2, partial [Gryllus bimaculatus]
MNYVARRYSYLERLPLWSFVNLMSPKAIVTRTAHEWFWGYSDAVKAFVELKQGKIKAGIIQSANGTSPDTMTVFTGVEDVSRLGEITRFNGLELMDFYSTKECNRVDGSDGARFPPPAVKPGATLHIYHREACRRVPIVYEKDVT